MSKISNNQISEELISFKAYEKMAKYYFESVDTKAYNAYYERPATISLLGNVSGKCALDAGCAAGWYTKWLIDNGAKVTAIDFSPSMVEMTKKRVGNKARIVEADLNQRLDFIEDESMEVVLSSLTLHYLKNWDLVLSEFNRILKKSSELIISIHHPFMDFTNFNRENYFLTELLEDEWTVNSAKVSVKFYRRPLSEIINSISDAGFIIEKILEPLPEEKFKEENPASYDKLMKNPQFLFIKSRKK